MSAAVVRTGLGRWAAAKSVDAIQTAGALPYSSSQRLKKNDCSRNSWSMAQMMYPHADCKFGNQVGLAGISPPAQLTTITMQTIVAKPIPSTTLAPNIFGNPRPRRWRHDRAERAERSSSTSARTRTRMVMAAMAAQRFRISGVGAQIANSKNRNATMIWAQTKYRRRAVGAAGRVFESTAICLSLYFHIFGAAIPEGMAPQRTGSAVESLAKTRTTRWRPRWRG